MLVELRRNSDYLLDTVPDKHPARPYLVILNGNSKEPTQVLSDSDLFVKRSRPRFELPTPDMLGNPDCTMKILETILLNPETRLKYGNIPVTIYNALARAFAPFKRLSDGGIGRVYILSLAELMMKSDDELKKVRDIGPISVVIFREVTSPYQSMITNPSSIP